MSKKSEKDKYRYTIRANMCCEAGDPAKTDFKALKMLFPIPCVRHTVHAQRGHHHG